MSDGVARARTLPASDTLFVLLSTSAEECVASVRARGHSIREDRIIKLREKCVRDAAALRDLGFQVEEHDRATALERVLSALAKNP